MISVCVGGRGGNFYGLYIDFYEILSYRTEYEDRALYIL